MEAETGSVQENRYDAEGLRFELLEKGGRINFVYRDGELLHEEGGNEKQISYHLGAGIDARQRGQELSYYHRDEQLSTAYITGGHGETQNSYLYDAFGAELEANEQLQNRIRYTGQQYDELTEQYYLRARYYSPVLGRFMQEDVYQGDGLNLYAYCHNNPVTYYDPSGYEGYYFRGTTEGFGGRRDYDFTFTSTDPSVAIAYAVRGQTETGLPGIVYIATDSDLAGISTETWYGSIPTDKEVYVYMSPDEFANAASISLEVSQARDILKDTTGVEVSSHIYGEEGLRAQLEDNYNKIKEDDINKFVEEARAANNADATEDADVTKDTPCS